MATKNVYRAMESANPLAGARLLESAQSFDACWLEMEADSDPFAAAAGDSLRFNLRLREVDYADPQIPAARLAVDMTVNGSLRIDDADGSSPEAENLRVLLDVAGAEIRIGRASGSAAALLRGYGIPGEADGTAVEEAAGFDTTVGLVRMQVAGRLRRWRAERGA